VGCFILLFKRELLPVFPPHLPDNALSSKLAVNGRVGAGYAVVKTFTAVAGEMFLARNGNIAIRMIFTMHGVPLYTESTR
jgi:hypothetical protein